MSKHQSGAVMDLNTFTDYLLPVLPVTKKTYKNYSNAYNFNIRPKLGYKELAEITKHDLVQALATLKPQTRYSTLMTLRVIYREAFERELIESNIAASIKAPKIHVKQQKFLTWEQLEQIDFGSQTKRIRFLALHGLRYGEAAALTEEDIYDGFVHITKSKYGATKTPAGVRKVPLLSEFQPFALNQISIASALKPYGVTVHSLRKTYAYTLKSAGIHVTTAAKLMGHSNPMMTLKVYTQVKDDEAGAAGISISNYIRKEPGITPRP
jgi:integrase